MILLARLILAAAVLCLLYSVFRYARSPQRKLAAARSKKQFYLADDSGDIRENFLMTYQGMLFEGEKYLSSEENQPEQLSIFISTEDAADMKKLRQEDVRFIQREITRRYPQAVIDWKSPAKYR